MKRILIGTILLTALLSAGCARKLGKDIRIDGADVSNLTTDEARTLVNARERERLGAFRVTLSYGDKTETLTSSELILEPDVDEALLRAMQLERDAAGRDVAVRWSVNEETVDEICDKIADSVNTLPQNAEMETDFSLETPFRFTPGTEGLTVDEAALKQKIRAAVEAGERASIEVPLIRTAPKITLEALSGSRQRVASYTTSFAESPYDAENRVYNIKKAASRINGTALAPGESFDCNAVLGDRTAENGWKLAPGIVNGAYEEEYGGGVCQVSSTLFNAVMAADFTITERHPHSWPMGYVDIGRDAAISTGGKNFCFVNSTDETAYLSALVDEIKKTVTVGVYGAPLDSGGHIEVFSERTGLLDPPETEYLLDETLPVETKRVERTARQGKTSRTYKSYFDADGTLIRTVVAYEDTYRSISGRTYVSPDIYYS